MVFIYCVIGVLGMVPTGGSGCCSRMLKGERSVGYVKYKRRPREVRFLRRPPRCRSQRHLSFFGVSSSFDCSCLTNATLGRTALHCIKMCSICQQKTHFCLPTKVRFLNDVCLRQMMLASPNDAWLRHILWQTSHHCGTQWSNIIFAKQMHHIAARRCIIEISWIL